jgi:hypothetical protein
LAWLGLVQFLDISSCDVLSQNVIGCLSSLKHTEELTPDYRNFGIGCYSLIPD